MEPIDRTQRILALILLHQMKGVPQQEKIRQLNLAGFSNIEIADILQTTTAVVSQSLYEARRRGKQTPARAKAAKRAKV